MKKYLVKNVVKKTKALFFSEVEQGDIISVEKDADGKVLVSRNEEIPFFIITETKLKKGLENLEVEDFVDSNSSLLESIKEDIKAVESALESSKGKEKRRLKKLKTRLNAELRKETLISKIIH